MSAHGTFATAITCMDGRTQEPVIRFLKERCGVDYVDVITAPGMDGNLVKDPMLQVSVKCSTEISVEKHGSRTVAVIGHADCAGNPVSAGEHAEYIRQGVDAVRSWNLPLPEIIGLWVNDRWEVERVC